MLKLIYTPTSEIKESDLVPGSKWRRKSDGAECVLCDGFSGSDHLMFCGGIPIIHGGSYHQVKDEMLAWLRRDFERAGESDVGEMKSVGVVPVGNLFVYDNKRYIKGCERNVNRDSLICWGLEHSGTSYFSDRTIVRDLAPIEIDDSVKGVG